MSDEKKSFGELLNESPLAAGENTVSLVGALARSHQPGKFVLALAGNQSVTLDVDAVKEYKVLSGTIGQLIVQVDVDRDRVPVSLGQGQPALAQPAFVPNAPFKNPIFDQVFTSFIVDHPFTNPIVDNPPVKFIFEGIPDPTGFGVNPAPFGGGFGPVAGGFAGLAPFALATPHQAPANALAAMGGGPNVAGQPLSLLRTVAWFDSHILPWHTGGFPHPD
jgi:hypothetical protein